MKFVRILPALAAMMLLGSASALADPVIPCPTATHLGAAPGLTAFGYAQTAPFGDDSVGSQSACSETTLLPATTLVSSALSQSFAQASYGALHVAVSGSNDETNPRSYASASARWTDSFQVDGGTGDGFFTMTIAVDGTFTGPGTSTLNYGLTAQYPSIGGPSPTGGGMTGTSVDTLVWDGHQYSVLSPQTSQLVFEVHFTYGTPFLLSGWTVLCGDTDVVGCGGNASESGPFSADFSQTANFFISGLAPDAILITDSGNSYAQDVEAPEPSSYLILCAGLGLIALGRSRRRLAALR